MKAAVAISRAALFLGIFAALAAALIAWTWATTKADIERSVRAAEARQLLEIFPANTHNNSLIDDRFIIDANTPLLELRGARSGYTVRQDDAVVGVILPATARDGYSGDIELLVGVTADGEIAGARVVSHKETPGLGDGIDTKKSPWIMSFDGTSLVSPSQPDWGVKRDGGAFDQFTGATVTPRAVVAAIRRTLEYQALHRDRLFEVDSTQNTPVETGP